MIKLMALEFRLVVSLVFVIGLLVVRLVFRIRLFVRMTSGLVSTIVAVCTMMTRVARLVVVTESLSSVRMIAVIRAFKTRMVKVAATMVVFV